jgi:hypothetical protein
MYIGCVEELTLFLESSASTVCPLEAHSFSDLFVNASIMKGVVLIGKAHIAAEHHLLNTRSILSGHINTLPLMMSGVNCLWSPSLKNERSVVIIVEDSLVSGIAPGTNEA